MIESFMQFMARKMREEFGLSPDTLTECIDRTPEDLNNFLKETYPEYLGKDKIPPRVCANYWFWEAMEGNEKAQYLVMQSIQEGIENRINSVIESLEVSEDEAYTSEDRFFDEEYC